jgi:hypothetical protein
MHSACRFFEAVVLEALIRRGVEQTLVMADITGVAAALSEEGVRSAGRAYQVEPVAVSQGCFHPKLVVLTSPTEAHLIISSGNLNVWWLGIKPRMCRAYPRRSFGRSIERRGPVSGIASERRYGPPQAAYEPKAETTGELAATPEQLEAETATPEPDANAGEQAPDVAPPEQPATQKSTRKSKTVTGEKVAKAPREASKTSRVIEMLKREGGATLDEIMTEMGWQKHTTRAMLSAGGSLTKNHGLVVTSEIVGDKRTYSIKA